MSSFSPALLDCSRTVAAHIYLLGVCGTYPQTQATYSNPWYKHPDLRNILPLNVRPLHQIVVERAIYTQVLFLSPLPAPRRISKSLKYTGMFEFDFYFFLTRSCVWAERGPRSRRHSART